MTQQLEDSPNFTDEDIAQAIDASETEVAQRLVSERCACPNVHTDREYLLRRKAPWHYWVVRLSCGECGHAKRLVFRLTDPVWRLPS